MSGAVYGGGKSPLFPFIVSVSEVSAVCFV